jgi:DNA-binding transcriptional regulator LsrR (DeoR family)
MRPDVLVKIATLFYVDKLTQTEIAERLRMSRFRVARLLQEASDRGVVTITICEPSSTAVYLERELERRFGLRQAIVVQPHARDDSVIKRALGRAAAALLENVLTERDVLGVSWGTTVKEVAEALRPRPALNIHVVQITGGLNQVAVGVNAPEVTRRIAEAFRGKSHLLHAPAILDKSSVRDGLLADSNVRQTVALFDRVSVALVGIGAFAPKATSTLVRAGCIGARDVAELVSSNVVGDVFSHFFDIDGKERDGRLANRLMAMSLDQIRRVPYVIGIAGGQDKVRAVLGALRGRLISALVTDNGTAEGVVKLADSL